MWGMYRLFYGELELGTITRTGGDFPWNWGRFEQVFDPAGSDLARHIEAYMQLGAQKYPHIEAEDFEALHVLEEEIERRFLDLIESEQWTLLDGEDRWSIMVPEFPEGNRIAWR